MAKDLNAGQKIELSDGSSVTVKKKLGEGRQGRDDNVQRQDREIHSP